MIDREKHDYYPHPELPAILVEVRKGGSLKENPYEIIPSMDKFVRSIIKRNPTWVLVSVTRPYGMSNFRVYAGTEKLGDVWRDRVRYDEVFVLTNVKIARSMKRNQNMVTKDVQKALRAVKDYFVPSTLADLVTQQRGLAVEALYEVNSDVEAKSYKAWYGLYPKLQQYVLDTWDASSAAMLRAGAPQNHVEALRPAVENQRVTNRIMAFWKAHVAVCVSIIDGVYYVSTTTDMQTTAKAYDALDLPKELRRNFGLLKLAPEKTALEGIGMRTSESTFVVIPTPTAQDAI